MENHTEAIRQVIESAYIQGVHGLQDLALVQSGFHEDFAMLVLHGNAIEKVAVEEWLERIEVMKAEDPSLWEAETQYTIELTDVSRNAAVAKLELYKGESHFSIDYMLLYRFEEGWRIVSKIFATGES